MLKKDTNKVDVKCGGSKEGGWSYTDLVKQHFMAPENLLFDESDYDSDGQGSIGSPTCGDTMFVWIKVDKKKKKIKECKWRTFGCASAVASASMMSVVVTEKDGMDLDKAKKLKPQDVMEKLGGVPDRKAHCSVLGLEALKEAILDYQNKND